MLALDAAEQPVSNPPEARAIQPYPRSAVAFSRALEQAVAAGLEEIRSDSRHGFVLFFAGGSTAVGAALLDVL
jgi:hypothetical protein